MKTPSINTHSDQFDHPDHPDQFDQFDHPDQFDHSDVSLLKLEKSSANFVLDRERVRFGGHSVSKK